MFFLFGLIEIIIKSLLKIFKVFLIIVMWFLCVGLNELG